MAGIRLNPVAVQATVNNFARKEARRVAGEVLRRAQLLSGELVNVDTGRYRAGWKTRTTFTARGPGVQVYNNVEYAPIIEEGSRPHVIRAKNKKALKFRVGGRTVIVTSVNHPGTKPKRVLATATRQVGAVNGYNVRITE